MPTQILDLPVERLESVLSHLPPSDLLNVLPTCKLLAAAAERPLYTHPTIKTPDGFIRFGEALAQRPSRQHLVRSLDWERLEIKWWGEGFERRVVSVTAEPATSIGIASRSDTVRAPWMDGLGVFDNCLSVTVDAAAVDVSLRWAQSWFPNVKTLAVAFLPITTPDGVVPPRWAACVKPSALDTLRLTSYAANSRFDPRGFLDFCTRGGSPWLVQLELHQQGDASQLFGIQLPALSRLGPSLRRLSWGVAQVRHHYGEASEPPPPVRECRLGDLLPNLVMLELKGSNWAGWWDPLAGEFLKLERLRITWLGQVGEEAESVINVLDPMNTPKLKRFRVSVADHGTGAQTAAVDAVCEAAVMRRVTCARDEDVDEEECWLASSRRFAADRAMELD